MYRIRHSSNGYTIEHYAKNDPNPTPTAVTLASRPEAWSHAMGKAAKMSIMLSAPQLVITDDNIVYEVMATRIAGVNGCCKTAMAMHAIKCPVCQRSASEMANLAARTEQALKL